MLTLPEEAFLLLLHREKHHVMPLSHYAVGAALLAQLVQAGAVSIPKPTFWGGPKALLNAGANDALAGDPFLPQARDIVADRGPNADRVVIRLGKTFIEPVAQRLIERGVLRRVERSRVFAATYEVLQPLADTEIRPRLTAVLLGSAEPDPQSRALLAVLYGLDLKVALVDPHAVRFGEVRKRAEAVIGQDYLWKALVHLGKGTIPVAFR